MPDAELGMHVGLRDEPDYAAINALVLAIIKMLVGILEYKSNPFISDVISRLNEVSVEFISLSDERIPIERGYRVVVDRMSFCYPYLKEVMKSLALSGTYVINNPFAASSSNKIVDIKIGSRVGLAFPRTVVLPNLEAIEGTEGLVAQPNLDKVAEKVGLPCILKPFDGYAWQDVYAVKSLEELRNLYSALSPRYILLAQQLIRYKDYFKSFCLDKRDVLFVRWIPKPFAMGQYLYSDPGSIKEVTDRLSEPTIQLNQLLDLDVNVIEWCVDEQGRWWVIDAFNEVPDITPEALPPEYYSWIVDRFAACIISKLDPSRSNRTAFG